MSNLIDLSQNDDQGVATITRAAWKRTGHNAFNGDLDLTFEIKSEADADLVAAFVPAALACYKSGVESETNIEGKRRGMTSGKLHGKPADKDVVLELADDGLIIRGDAVVRRLTFSWDGEEAAYTMRVRFEKVDPDTIALVMAALESDVDVEYKARQLKVDGGTDADNREHTGEELPPEPVA